MAAALAARRRERHLRAVSRRPRLELWHAHLDQMLILASQDVSYPLRPRERVPNDARVAAAHGRRAPRTHSRRRAAAPVTVAGTRGCVARALRRGSPRAPASRRSTGPAGPGRAAAPAGAESFPVCPGARGRGDLGGVRGALPGAATAWSGGSAADARLHSGRDRPALRAPRTGLVRDRSAHPRFAAVAPAAGFDGQPIARVAAAWLPIGYVFGLAVPRARPLWLALGAAAFGALLLVAASNASFALADNLRLTAVLWHRLPPLGPWLEAGLFAIGALLPAAHMPPARPVHARSGGRACAPPYRLNLGAHVRAWTGD